MSKKKRKNKSGRYGEDGRRRRTARALILLIVLAVSVFMLSEAPGIRNARQKVLQKAGIAGEQQSSDAGPAGGDGSTNSDGSDIAVPEGAVKAGPESGDENYSSVDMIDGSALPEYDGHHYVIVNGNVPLIADEVFEKAGLVKSGAKWQTPGGLPGTVDRSRLIPYEYYGRLDKLGRCTAAYGCLGDETMPSDDAERGDISSIHPSGWASGQNWERSHLIAWKLGAENDNECNLVTGTHYFNCDGMRPEEERTEKYIWDTGNHVIYFVKPWYSGSELIPRGVQMQASSVEDGGKGLSFNLYMFNVTPEAAIDYNTGIVSTAKQITQGPRAYVINKKRGVFHYPSCQSVEEMSENNREDVTATRTELIGMGYKPCGSCEP